MVYIHGGSFIFGDGYEIGIYDAKSLALEQNIVVVAINYRLSILGGFASKAFADEHPGRTVGEEMEWVIAINYRP